MPARIAEKLWRFLSACVLLIGPVLLKTGSTLYRFARYYAGARPYGGDQSRRPLSHGLAREMCPARHGRADLRRPMHDIHSHGSSVHPVRNLGVVVLQYGLVLTALMVSVVDAAPPMVDAMGRVVTSASFGVGRGFAVIVAAFASLFMLTVLGGLFRESWQRKRRDKHL